MMRTMTRKETTIEAPAPGAARRIRRGRLFGSLRWRLAASVVALLALSIGLSVVVVREILLLRADERIQDELEQETEEFQNIATGPDPRTGRPLGSRIGRIFNIYLQSNIPGNDEVFLTVPRQAPARYLPSAEASPIGRAFVESAPVNRWRELSAAISGKLQTGEGEARYLATPVRSQDQVLGAFVVSVFNAAEYDAANAAIRIIVVVGAVALLAGSLLAVMLSRRLVGPLHELTAATREISGAELGRRVEVDGEDEIADLARTFNRMLDRLEGTFDDQRAFMRDVGHELRTPISVLQGHLELLLETKPRGDDHETLSLLNDELARMSRFVDELGLLAKAESPRFLRLETVELDGLCRELLAKADAIAGRRWVYDGAPRRSVVADRQRLTQAMMNLIQNAVTHTAADQVVAVGAAVEGNEATLWVRDEGGGVPPGDRERIFERFAQGPRDLNARDGTGLGLAIVRAIAEAHGGSARLAEWAGTTRFEIVVPVDPEQEEALRGGEVR
jgi:two-component system OmpR family sensor kinase